MKIKKIHFISGTSNEATTCDCCGRSISNIYHIVLADNSELRLGTTCFSKQMKDNLDKMSKKKVNQAIGFITSWNEVKTNWETKTEEELRELYPNEFEKIGKYEGIDSFEDIKNWIINELCPYRIRLHEADIIKYAKIGDK